MQTFFSDDDYREYIALMADSCRRYDVDVWAYCPRNCPWRDIRVTRIFAGTVLD